MFLAVSSVLASRSNSYASRASTAASTSRSDGTGLPTGEGTQGALHAQPTRMQAASTSPAARAVAALRALPAARTVALTRTALPDPGQEPRDGSVPTIASSSSGSLGAPFE